MAPVSCGSMGHQLDERYRPLMVPFTSDVVFSQFDTSGVTGKESVVILKSAVINQLMVELALLPRMSRAGPLLWQIDGSILTDLSHLMNWGSFRGTLTEGWTFAVVVKVCLDGGQ